MGIVPAALVFLAVVGLAIGTRPSPARAVIAEGEASFVPELGVPAREVVAFGASPAEAPGEVWAYGYLGPVPPAGQPDQANRYTLLRRTDAGGWQLVPLPGGAALGAKDGFPSRLGALAGQATPAGSLVLLTDAGIVARDPGAAPALLPSPAGDPELLGGRESLPPSSPAGEEPTPYAVFDAAGGRAGLFIAPYPSPAPEPEGNLPVGILHYDGGAWSREAIERPGDESVRPLAIGCGPTGERPDAVSPDNCWLLARVGADGDARLGLFRREAGGGGSDPVWQPLEVDGGLLGGQQGSPPQGPGSVALAPLGGNAQMLTVTSQGIWVDFAASLDGSEPRSASELVAPAPVGARVLGSWCHPTGPGCERSLGAAFPAAYRSFAWPGGSAEDPGARLITGLGERAMLELSGGSFAYAAGAGGSPGIAPGGAAFLAPDRGFLADGADPGAARDGAGQSQVFALTSEPAASRLAAEPVPFRHPLLAVAAAPGGGVGEAMAVGLEGQVARFVPGEGWRPFPTLTAPGIGPVNLRDVAWPSPDRAFAVGDRGAVLRWDRASDAWTPYPAEVASFNSVAFSEVDPTRGFAVGQQQIISYAEGAAAWRYSQVPLELLQLGGVDLTSVAFAGNEALAGFRSVGAEGGVIVEDGSGWRIDPEVAALLGSLPPEVDIAPSEVAGLPDGGAVVAGPGWVIKRESASAPWALSAQPLPEARAAAALAAYRDAAGSVRAILSVALGPYRPDPPANGGYHPADAPPASGYVLRETAAGWEDMQHQALAVEAGSAGLPARPEPVLDLVVNRDGEAGIAVGGQSGNFTGSGPQPSGSAADGRYETAAAMRFPPETVHDPNDSVPFSDAAPRPLFVAFGHAACADPCASQAKVGLGPDVALTRALETARRMKEDQAEHLRAAIYTGGRLESGIADERELGRLAELFGGSGSLPLLTAASPDLTAAGPSLFTSIFAPFGPSTGSTYYAYRSEEASGEDLDVIVLDYSAGALGPAQESWLREQLAAAKSEGVASIVVGSAALGFILPESPAGIAPVQRADDAEAVEAILLEGGASAYVYPGANLVSWIGDGEVPAFGTGVLGYGTPRGKAAYWLGSASLLLLELIPEAERLNNRAPVFARGIPVIESLMLRSAAGTRLRSGETARFEALGRRPAAGIKVEEVGGRPVFAGPEPYETLPPGFSESMCAGDPNCANAIQPEFAFSSSNPAVGDFVFRIDGPGDGDDRLLPDPRSGSFCAKSPGETTVSVTAGGLVHSQRIVVTAERVDRPCFESTALPAQPTPAVAPPPAPESSPQVPPSPSAPPGPAPQPQPPAHQPGSPAAPVSPLAPNPVPSPAPTPAPAVVLPPSPVLLQPPAPPVGVSSVSTPAGAPSPAGATSPVNVPSPVAQAAVSPAERDEVEVALDLSHEMRAHRLDATLLPVLALVGAFGLASVLTTAAGRRRAYLGATAGRSRARRR